MINNPTPSAPKGGNTGAGKKSKISVVGKGHQNEDEDEDENEEDDDEEEEGEEREISSSVLRRVMALKNKQEEMDEVVEKQYKIERIALEKKYLNLRLPYFEFRNQVVSGEIEPPVPVDSEAGPEETSVGTDEKGIPGFWLQSLASHSSIGYLITEEDEPALEALTDIKCEYDEEFTSFTLFFHFKENDFFSNSVLTKKYGVTPSLLDDTAPALTLNEGSEIDWKPSKNLCVKEVTKKQKAKGGKNKGQVRTVTSTLPQPSFFHYFSQPLPEEEEDEEEEPKDDEDEEKIKLNMEEDYDIGHTIRTAIIPQAVLWFTGDAEDGEYEDGDDDEDMDEDGDDDEDADEEEDEAPKDRKILKSAGKKGGKGGFASEGAAGGKAGEAQPECKQN